MSIRTLISGGLVAHDDLGVGAGPRPRVCLPSLWPPISCSTPQPYVKNDNPNHRFDFGNCAMAFSLAREGEVPLWL